MEEKLLYIIITFVTTILTSSGVWTFVLKRSESKSLERQLLIGLAHDRIVTLAVKHIERGYITQDEYENLRLIYQPYLDIGGNGGAKRVMAEVDKLPICKSPPISVSKEKTNAVDCA